MPDKSNTPVSFYQQSIDFLKKLPRYGAFRFFTLWALSWLLLMSFLLSEFLKKSNYVEVFPEWLITPTLVHVATAVVIATVIYFFKRPATWGGKAVAVIILTLLFANYDSRLVIVSDLIQTFMPILPASSGGTMAIVSLVFMAGLTAGAIGLGILVDKLQKKRPNLKSSNIVLASLIVVGFIFASQAFRSVPILAELLEQGNVQASKFTTEAETPSDKPDVYYLVFDRYGSNAALKESLNYDNSAFTNKLEAEGFTVNKDAYSSYPVTSMSIPSALTANYTNDLTDPFKDSSVHSHILYHNLTQQSPVIKAFKDAGYQYHNIGSVYGASAKAPLADVDHMYEIQLEAFGQKKRMRGIEKTTFTKSIFYRFTLLNDISWWPLKTKELPASDYTTNQLATLNDLARAEPGGRFIFAHLLLPHPLYYFNADGSLSPYMNEDSEGKPIAQKYLDQLQFANSRIEQLVELIKEKSNGEAVIIMNADEGPYPDQLISNAYHQTEPINYSPDDLTTWPDSWLRLKYGIQQAAYIPKANEQDLSHLSATNSLRIVLNRYLGYNLEYLPQCSLSLQDGKRPFNQVDLTERLTGRTSEFCTQLVD